MSTDLDKIDFIKIFFALKSKLIWNAFCKTTDELLKLITPHENDSIQTRVDFYSNSYYTLFV
jgi:hypothetical protein